MTQHLFSPSWYRVAGLRPSIRSHTRFHRHSYRGRRWYVVQDRASGRCHRLSPVAYQVAGLLDGERTLQEVWQLASEQLGDDGPTQDETIRLLGLLHSVDVLRCDVTPDTEEIFRRQQRRNDSEWWRRVASPLSIRIPLVDPDAMLERWLPFVRPLFSRPAALLFCALVLGVGIAAAPSWVEFTHGSREVLLDPGNLLLVIFLYPIVKGLHELGHAFATRVWGGEVHQMGIQFLVFMPLPFVDASAASAFPEKHRRIVVGAAGIIVEIVLGAIALLVWLYTEPGLVRSIAYNVVWIGGVSTLLFNGNPLLKFDGYYVLSDLLEIPNLDARSRQHLHSVALRRLFGLQDGRDPASAPGETRWFVAYGVASSIYRLGIAFSIALFVAGKFFIVGILLALFSLGMQIVAPLIRLASFVLTSPRLLEHRGRAIFATVAVASLLAGLVFLLPIHSRTRAEGVVWPPEGAEVRAKADGFVVRLLNEPNARVEPGDPLILTVDSSREAQVALLEAELRELKARYNSERGPDLAQSRITLDEIRTKSAALAHAKDRVGDVVLRSPAHGSFVLAQPVELEGRFLKQGELVGYVLGATIDTARVVIPQAYATLVREHTQGVELRLSRALGQVLPASIRREIPGASDELPSRALGSAGGGRFVVDPSDPSGLHTLDHFFQIELSFAQDIPVAEIGSRVHVLIDHGSEPLSAQAGRSLRRLLMRQLGV
jgi:putative peptide zinc metalloprotease protein